MLDECLLLCVRTGQKAQGPPSVAEDVAGAGWTFRGFTLRPRSPLVFLPVVLLIKTKNPKNIG